MAAHSAAVAALNLSRAFEERLLAAPAGEARRVPAVIISGFLGSGKTTLLRSLLRSRGNLRFAVIMNELAEADVDSGLMGGAGANAACGLPLLSIASSCLCCSGLGELRAALRQALDAGEAVDAVLLETTGLADPAPLASVLEAAGARLDCVVTVVDAEAARSQLAGGLAPTLHAQLRCADLVLLNKCDLLDLAGVADTEDALAQLTQARVMRCRHGNVPVTAVLDAHASPPPPPPVDAPAGTGGFISHEDAPPTELRLAVASDRECSGRGGRGIKRRLEEDAAAAGPLVRRSHAVELERVSTVVWRAAAAPVCAAAFATWLLHDVALAKGVLRAKGQLFLAQRRRRRVEFHFSGARRTEVLEREPWEGAPETTVVLIGTDEPELLALRDRLQAVLREPAEADAGAGAADVFSQLLAADACFEVLPLAGADAHAKDVRGFASFTLRGMPQRGVEGAALNFALLQRVNGAQKAFLLWGTAAQQPQQLTCLRLAFRGDEDAAAAHACVLLHAESVLREAYAHVGLCNC